MSSRRAPHDAARRPTNGSARLFAAKSVTTEIVNWSLSMDSPRSMYGVTKGLDTWTASMNTSRAATTRPSGAPRIRLRNPIGLTRRAGGRYRGSDCATRAGVLRARLRLAAMKSSANDASSSGVCSNREIKTPPSSSPASRAIWQILLRRLK